MLIYHPPFRAQLISHVIRFNKQCFFLSLSLSFLPPLCEKFRLINAFHVLSSPENLTKNVIIHERTWNGIGSMHSFEPVSNIFRDGRIGGGWPVDAGNHWRATCASSLPIINPADNDDMFIFFICILGEEPFDRVHSLPLHWRSISPPNLYYIYILKPQLTLETPRYDSFSVSRRRRVIRIYKFRGEA